MGVSIVGVVKQVFKKVLTIAAASVMAFSGLSIAAPLFFTGNAAASADTSAVFINEVSPASGTEWVELYNKSSNSVDISGWHIRHDSITTNFGGVIPDNTVIPAYGYYVQTSATSYLPDGGGTVKICVDNGCTETGDSFTYPGGLSASQSYGRSTNGDSTSSIFASPTQGASNDASSELSVCATANNSRCDFSDINEAVSQIGDNGTIHVGSGNFGSFSVDGKTGLTIQGLGVGATNIVPASLVNTTIGHKYTSNMQVSVLVVNSSDLTIDGMTISDGGLAADSIVLWDASSGTIGNVNVSGSTTAVNISGTQTGQGIAVDGGTTDLTLNSVSISGYQKNGVDIEDGNDGQTGAGNITVNINGGSISGVGNTSANAQNGVVAWNQAGGTITATVDGTSISNLNFTDPSNTATGILAYGGAHVTSISNTAFTNVQTYIANVSGGSAIDASSGNSFDGVSPASASGGQLATIENKIYGAAEDASSKPVYLLPNTIVTTPALSTQTAVDGAGNGDTIYLTPGTYNESAINLNKPVTIDGHNAATLVVPDGAQVNGFDINANDVTIKNMTIEGPAVNTSYLTYAWGGNVTRGIAVHNGYTGFNITGDTIQGLRNDVLIDGRNTGSLTNNVIDNSKSGVSVQYTDAGAGNTEGYSITMTGNQPGTYGNEWGLNTHLNGHWVSGTYFSNSQKIATDAPASVQAALLANSSANNGWTVQDQGYSNYNRTAVNVGGSNASDSNQGSPLNQLATIQSGADATVSGGTVNVAAGTYNETVTVSHGVTLTGDNKASVINGGLYLNHTDGVVNISGFTFQNAGTISGDTASIVASHPSATVNIDGNHFVGIGNNGSNPFDNAIWVYHPTASGDINITNNEFDHQWQSILLERPIGGATLTGNNFHDLVANSAGATTYEAEGAVALAYSGENVTNPVVITDNQFSNFSGKAIALSGGYPGEAPAQFTDVQIKNNQISLSGGDAITLRNAATTSADAAAGGIQGAVVSGNTIASSASTGSAIHLQGVNDNATVTGNTITGFAKSLLSDEYASGAGTSSGLTAANNLWNGGNQTVTLPVSGNQATTPATETTDLSVSTPSGQIQVSIPAGTTITASGGTWDGIINPPTVKSNASVSIPTPSGMTTTVATVIEVGSNSVSLTFDNAVRLVLPGQAGKLVGFIRNGDFTQITNVCSADSQAAGNSLPAGGDCYINVGSDLVVWTKHFTTFVAYSSKSSSSGSSSSSSSSSSSNGSTTPTATETSASNGGSAGQVKGQSTSASNGKTSSLATKTPATASLSQPKAAAKEANGGGLRWYWYVLIAVAALALAAGVAYRYAEGTDEA